MLGEVLPSIVQTGRSSEFARPRGARRAEHLNTSGSSRNGRRSRFGHWLLAAALGLGGLGGCDVGPDGATPIGARQQGLCNPGNAGGDLGCACTDNNECFNYDEDARLIICNVPAGGTVGTCIDCLAATPRPIGCSCDTDAQCATGSVCNGRTCQSLRLRGEFCTFDTDCGSDMLGAMNCLPTKMYCGPAPDGYFCDFDTDCLNGTCNDLGVCTSGAAGQDCASDANCKAPLVCSLITYQCVDKQADGAPCARNAECVNQCNSFSGRCQLGDEGQPCTTMNPDGDCITGLTCTDCGGAFNCRPAGSNCP